MVVERRTVYLSGEGNQPVIKTTTLNPFAQRSLTQCRITPSTAVPTTQASPKGKECNEVSGLAEVERN